MLILPSAILLAAFSLFITALLAPPNKPAYLLSLYLCAYAGVILASEVANTLLVLNQAWAVLAIQLLISGGAAALWVKAGRPSFWGPFRGWKDELRGGLRLALKAWPELGLLGLGGTLAYLLAAVLILVVPPNNNDSMSTHLSRVGYWLQHGSFFPWPTSRTLQLIYPLDAQLQMFWTVLFLRSDALVGFVQWAAALACGVGIFAMARFLGWSRPQSAFAALIFPGFPLVLLQATTTQNDLVIAALALPALYFLLLGLRTGQSKMLLLSGLSLGLALGTKQSGYFLLVAFSIILALVWLKERKGMFRPLLRWIGYTALCFALLSAYQYAINWAYFGSPMGPSRVIDDSVGGQDISWAGGNVFYNAPRLVYQSLDVSGLPNPLDGLAYKVKAYATAWLVKQVGYQIEGTRYTTPPHEFVLLRKTENQEDQAWYGPLSVLLLFPAMVYQLANGLRKREPVRVGLVIVAVLFLFVDAWLRPGWDPFQGRYFATVFALNAPLMAGIFQPRPLARAFRWFAVILALVVMTITMLYNPAKPIAGKKARNVNIWTADRATVQTIQGFFSRDLLRMIERVVPADATLGLYTPGYVWDYPLFGKNFTRRLVPIYPFGNGADMAWLEDQKIEFILVQKGVPPIPNLPKAAEQQSTVEGWVLYRLNP